MPAASAMGSPPTCAGSLPRSVGSIRRPYRPTVPLGHGVAAMGTPVSAGGVVTTTDPQPETAMTATLTRTANTGSRLICERDCERDCERPSEFTAHDRVP